VTSLLTEGSGMTAVDASGASSVAWLLIALPMVGAAVLLLGGRRTDRFGPLLATGLSWGSFVVGLVVLLQLVGLPAEERV
jgi:NADH-quinone oxidoreductase subunit L